MHSTPETRARADAVVEYIKAHPERHNQSNWAEILDEQIEDMIDEPGGNVNDIPMCKTTMCVAGTAAWQKHGNVIFTQNWQDRHDWMKEGMALLGLSYAEANYLFYDTDNEEALDIVEGLAVGEWRGLTV